MSTVSNAASGMVDNNVASQISETTSAKKTKVKGKTIGTPELSDKAAKYYEELKKKYGNMDFILVSKDMKEQAQAQAGSFANANKMVVLIDEEKIERMAEDEEYRKQYEGIINNAASGLSQLKSQLSGSSDVKGFGIKVNDNGTTSLFAVVDKSLAAQRERMAKKANEKRENKKTVEREKRQEKLEQKRKDNIKSDEDTVTVTASSIDELLQKIQDVTYNALSDNVRTNEEKQLGQHVDFRM